MEAVLATMHLDVMWANGMEGGHVHGHDGVRNYWTRQWAIIDPHVEPANFSAGRMERQCRGARRPCAISRVACVGQDGGHIFRMEDGLIRRFDIDSIVCVTSN